ncbi:ATP-dependent DNA helicase PIF1-like protein [Tanacetum coccineum]
MSSVNTFTVVEEQRLKWTRNNQDTLRVDLYHNMCDAVRRGDTSAAGLKKKIVLPQSFIGSPRYMMHNYQDAMALCRAYGNPNLFITFTSNPKWDEIFDMLAHIPGQKSHDRPEIGTRVFKMKLTKLMDDLTKRHVFGGLPHAHILLWLEERFKFTTPDEINDIIAAELPSPTKDPDGYKVVSEFMLHGPYGKDAKYAPCTIEGKCSKHYPKVFLEETMIDEDGYPIYRGRNNKVIAKKGERYNRVDGASVQISQVDEIKNYLNWRFIALCEAVWRLFSFDIHYSYPTIMQLNYHLPNQNAVTLHDSEDLPALLEKEGINITMFTDWFELNKRDLAARGYTYAEIPHHYVWHAQQKIWRPRKQKKCIGRIVYSSPASGEHSACFAYGLLNDDKEWSHAIAEAKFWAMGPQLRDLFVTILLFCDILSVIPKAKRPEVVQSCINRSKLWKCCKVFTLTRSMRVNEYTDNGDIDTRKQDLNTWVLAVGDGRLSAKKKETEDEPTWIEIPEDFLIRTWRNPIEQIVLETYLNFITRQSDESYLKERAILTPRNDDADAINEFMFKKLGGASVTYHTADEICKASADTEDQHHLYPIEFLNTLNFPGMPPHTLCLKRELPVMLVRNLNPALGLCNSTRLIITELC